MYDYLAVTGAGPPPEVTTESGANADDSGTTLVAGAGEEADASASPPFGALDLTRSRGAHADVRSTRDRPGAGPRAAPPRVLTRSCVPALGQRGEAGSPTRGVPPPPTLLGELFVTARIRGYSFFQSVDMAFVFCPLQSSSQYSETMPERSTT